MTRLEWAKEHLEISALPYDEQECLKNGMSIEQLIIQCYCPTHLGIPCICVQAEVEGACTNCWNEEYRGA